MALQIPDQLKSQAPQSMWGKILVTSPVIMAVLSTMLAGLSSSEMTKAQYDRALAAQRQSKAGDQWNFFQAKRLRGATQRTTLDLLQAISPVEPIGSDRLVLHAVQLPEKQKKDLLDAINSSDDQHAIEALQQGKVPSIGEANPPEPNLKKALDAIEGLESEAQIAPLVAQVDDKTLEAALRTAVERTQALDDATKPVTKGIAHIESLLGRTPSDPQAAALRRDFAAARMAFDSSRYEIEAQFNRVIANLYELEVRRANLSAERHHARSQRFFYGMLAAQLAVIISTFAIAARQRNLLWSLAAAAGALAFFFAGYVYLYV
jgi:hypothetical protein